MTVTPTPPEPTPTGPRPPQRSPRRGMCAAVLSLEGIVIALSTPVMIAVEDVSTTAALVSGLGLALVCFLVAGLLRAEWAYTLGWAVQVGAVALGFAVPLMFFLGVLFGALWATAVWLGRKIDRERAAAYAGVRADA